MTEFTQALAAHLQAALQTARRRAADLRHDERGSVTIQEVLWAIAAIGFVAIVVAAITAYLNNQVSLIR